MPASDVRVVLVSPRNPINIGSVARAMANFGLSDLIAVSPFSEAWREAKSAVGAEELLKKAKLSTLAEALADCDLVLGTTAGRRRDLRQPVVPLPGLRSYIEERLPSGGRVAVLFGSEKTGLRNRDLERCHAILTVPTQPSAPSMNLSHAVAVVCYELSRASGKEERKEPAAEPPTVQQLEDLLKKALAAVERVGYMEDLPLKVRAQKIRAKLMRWRMTKQDAAWLQALFKRVTG